MMMTMITIEKKTEIRWHTYSHRGCYLHRTDHRSERSRHTLAALICTFSTYCIESRQFCTCTPLHTIYYKLFQRAAKLERNKQPFNCLFSKTTCISQHQKGRTIWILMRQEMMGWKWHQLDQTHFASDRKPRPHLITQFFTGQLFLTLNSQY